MNALTDLPKIESAALATLSIKDTVLAQFADAERTVTALAEKYKRVAYDCTTTKGMADAKAARLDLRENGRYAVQRAEAKVKTEVNDLKRIMAGEVERLVGIVRPVEDAIDQQIKAREEQIAAEKAERERQAAEAARVEAERRQRLEDGIATLAGYVQKAQGKTADAMAAGIAFVEKIVIDPAHWQEYTERASGTLAGTLQALRTMHANQVKAEADAAELEALRREKAEMEAKERAQREQAEAEERARMEFLRIQTEAKITAIVTPPADQPYSPPLRPTPLPAEPDYDALERELVDGPVYDETPAPTMKLSAICERLGFVVTRAFLESIGIKPVGTDKNAVLFAESDWPSICDAIISHVKFKRDA